METISVRTFGELLKLYRKQRGMTQQQLAMNLGVHYNTIWAWEHGDYLPDTKGIVLELARHLGINELKTRQLLEASLVQPTFSARWSVPYQRNPFFVGREAVLQQIHKEMTTIGQSFILSGLGGIGKTQTAIEYIYRYFQNYSAVFWVDATTLEHITADFLAIAQVLELPEKQKRDQRTIVKAVIHWLDLQSRWLLVLDNVDNVELVKHFLPTRQRGSLLFTTRLDTLEMPGPLLYLEPMTLEEGVSFLLCRTKRFDPGTLLSQMVSNDDSAARSLVETMDGLPLALDQASAYIEETQCGLADFLRLYTRYPLKLLSEQNMYGGHPLSVVQTFSLTFKRLQQRDPVAADLLTLCSFLASDPIPEKLLTDNAAFLGSTLASVVSHPSQFKILLQDLLATSFIRHDAHMGTIKVHRLVQIVCREMMPVMCQSQWLKRAITLMNYAFPPLVLRLIGRVEEKDWSWCEQLLPHVLVCISLSKRYQLFSLDVSSLLLRVAAYLRDRERYTEAEPLFLQALALEEQLRGPLSLEFIGPLHGLADLYKKQGKYEKAESLLLRALALQSNLAVDQIEMAPSFYLLAVIASKQGKVVEAQELFKRSFAYLGTGSNSGQFPASYSLSVHRKTNSCATSMHSRKIHSQTVSETE